MEKVKLSQFREDPDNVSEATDEEIARLAEKLKRVPSGLTAMRIAYVTDAPGGGSMVISGNKRLRCLKAAFGPNGEVPAEWFQDVTSMTAEERHEFRLNANISDGHWNIEKLLEQYSTSELSSAGLDALLADLPEAEAEVGKTDEDAVPDVAEDAPVVSKRGEVYALGRHRLMCGDSTSKVDVAQLVQGGGTDLLLTDPPYNVNYKGKAGKIANDNMKSEEFRAFLIKAFSAANSVLKPGGVFYVWYASSSVIDFASAVNAVGWKTHEELIWVKDSLVLGRCDYQMRHEPCLYGWKVGEKHLWRSDRRQTSVIDLVPEHIVRDGDTIQFYVGGRLFQCSAQTIFEVVDGTVIPVDKPTVNKSHPTMKPVALFAYQIRNSSKPGAYVLDLFGGSGTTLIACEQTNRRARLMELDPHYCDVIRRRWAEYVHGEGCDWEALTPITNND